MEMTYTRMKAAKEAITSSLETLDQSVHQRKVSMVGAWKD